MGQNFIACDRGQAFLMPPSLADWVPEDHLVWTVIGAVEQMNLDAFYGAYRANGQGRAAYDPEMMLALLLYAYSTGIFSSRGIERACEVDVAFKLITALHVPDHSTIAEFRRRHEHAIAGVFTSVLALCAEAGLVSVGVISIDGTKIKANASRDQNRAYASIVSELLARAEQTDCDEDEEHGDDRGDELPERFRSRASRRRALEEARQRLEAERAGDPGQAEEFEPDPGFELDVERLEQQRQGRRSWFRESRRQLEEHREQQAVPVPRAREARLELAQQRLEGQHSVEVQTAAAYSEFRAHGRDIEGRRLGQRPNQYLPPVLPQGRVNLSDPDSHVMRTQGQPTVQGYNAQAAVTTGQIIVAAEIAIASPDFGHLRPVFDAALRDLALAGVSERPGTVLGDAGYWHTEQMESIVAEGTQVLIPPDSSLKEKPRAGWTGGRYDFMRAVLSSEHGHAIYRQRAQSIEPVFGNTKHNRGFRQFRRRGRSAARSEWRLIAATNNLLKLHQHWIQPAPG